MACAHTSARGQWTQKVPADATRIAEILRSQDPWPVAADAGRRSFGHLGHQPRPLMGTTIGGGSGVQIQWPDLSGMSGSHEVRQMAERLSVLLAGLQRQCEVERQDMEQKLDQVGNHMDSRVADLETRMALCEEHTVRLVQQEPVEPTANAADASRALREVRALVSGAVSEVQAQWRVQRTELRTEQQDSIQKLEEFSEKTERNTLRLRQVEHILEGHVRTFQQREQELQGLLLREKEQPSWVAQVEATMAALERHNDEQRVAAEAALGRLRLDMDAIRMRVESFKSEALCSVDQRLDEELEHLEAARKAPDLLASDQRQKEKDLARRVDDIEARLAAVKVRVDAHDSRLGSLGERAEALCQQALDGARQVVARQREETLSEVDCEMRMLRQRVETMGELCEELSLREIGHVPRSVSASLGSDCRRPHRLLSDDKAL
eukprot:gnl/TRDRNA2_/TRDRNA2_94134_c0_seq1.p1 gnl/TRDRNA2_/TRDRNA2_94134_c0~~gnl/TRDRNA2_/TRDRNA2_94134_c0_seq1.p1  ORF type:complete len:450 (+),score=105.45 gnl/TRDRNA2_/TRDRNA2_94134_c0_seq1:41-1351(+)